MEAPPPSSEEMLLLELLSETSEPPYRMHETPTSEQRSGLDEHPEQVAVVVSLRKVHWHRGVTHEFQ